MIEYWFANPIVLAADPGLGAALSQFILLFAPLFLIWYFLVILPQQRQRRKTQEMLSNLKTGDRVLTSGGIYGSVQGFRGDTVQLQIASQVRVDVARSSIVGLQGAESGESASKEVKAAKGNK